MMTTENRRKETGARPHHRRGNVVKAAIPAVGQRFQQRSGTLRATMVHSHRAIRRVAVFDERECVHGMAELTERRKGTGPRLGQD